MGSRAWREENDPHRRNGQERLNGDGASRLLALRTGDLFTCPESAGEPNAMPSMAAFLLAPPGRLGKATTAKYRQKEFWGLMSFVSVLL